MTLDILLVEPVDAIYDALLSWFTTVVPDSTVQRTTAATDALHQTAANPPDLIVLRSEPCGSRLLQNVEAFSAQVPDASIVVLTDGSNPAPGQELKTAGAARIVSIWDLSARLGPFLQQLAGTDRADWERHAYKGPVQPDASESIDAGA